MGCCYNLSFIIKACTRQQRSRQKWNIFFLYFLLGSFSFIFYCKYLPREHTLVYTTLSKNIVRTQCNKCTWRGIIVELLWGSNKWWTTNFISFVQGRFQRVFLSIISSENLMNPLHSHNVWPSTIQWNYNFIV